MNNTYATALTEVLGDRWDYTPTGSAFLVTLKNKESGWNRQAEDRNLAQALFPLLDAGWTAAPGTKNFRTGMYNELIVQPPNEQVDTATLPLELRISVETTTEHKRWRELIEVDAEEGAVTFDSTGQPRYIGSKIEELAYSLRDAGWTGPIARRFGQHGQYGTLTAPKNGLNVPPARVEHYG